MIYILILALADTRFHVHGWWTEFYPSQKSPLEKLKHMDGQCTGYINNNVVCKVYVFLHILVVCVQRESVADYAVEIQKFLCHLILG